MRERETQRDRDSERERSKERETDDEGLGGREEGTPTKLSICISKRSPPTSSAL